MAPRAFDKFFEGVKKFTGGPDAAWGQQQQDASVPEEYAEFLDDDEGGTFMALDPESTGSVDGSSETTFGPLAMLAVGLLPEEFATLQSLLIELGAEEVALIPCTAAMMNCTLGDAVSVDAVPQYETPVLGTRRVVFLSGMYASEVIEVVAALRASTLPDMAVAAAVPNSWNRNLKDLVVDVFADHAAMARRRAEAALEAARAGQDGEADG